MFRCCEPLLLLLVFIPFFFRMISQLAVVQKGLLIPVKVTLKSSFSVILTQRCPTILWFLKAILSFVLLF